VSRKWGTVQWHCGKLSNFGLSESRLKIFSSRTLPKNSKFGAETPPPPKKRNLGVNVKFWALLCWKFVAVIRKVGALCHTFFSYYYNSQCRWWAVANLQPNVSSCMHIGSRATLHATISLLWCTNMHYHCPYIQLVYYADKQLSTLCGTFQVSFEQSTSYWQSKCFSLLVFRQAGLSTVSTKLPISVQCRISIL